MMKDKKTTSKQLTPNTYQRLISDIAGIYDRALKDVHLAVDGILKEAYWKIGKRIVEVEQDGHIRARYGAHLLDQISDDMTKTNRKGFSVSNLKNMRQVYATFPIRQLAGELTWTHYVVLSVIKDKEERQTYLKKASEKKWSVPQLREMLLRDQVKTIPPGVGAPKGLSAPGEDGSAEVRVIRLAVKRGLLNVFRVVENPVPKKENSADIWLDCGFRCTKGIEAGTLGVFKPGDIVSLSGTLSEVTALKKFAPKDFRADSVLYTYAARLVKVIDADTVNVEVNAAKALWMRKKLRLRRINAPEIDTPEGKKAKDFVVRTLKDCPWIVVKTYSTDIYDRYLVDIFYIPGCEDPHRIALEGKLLNQELLDAGLAELWRTPDPLDLAMMN